MRIKTIFLLLLAALPLSAADRFVTFADQGGAVALKGATITYTDTEPQAVKIAAASLVNDFQNVMSFLRDSMRGGCLKNVSAHVSWGAQMPGNPVF